MNAVEELKIQTQEPYRPLCETTRVGYSSLMRWKARLIQGVPVVQKPGPKKEPGLDRQQLELDLGGLRHVRARSYGSTQLYQRYRPQLSRRSLQGLIRERRIALNREREESLCRIIWRVPGSVWAMDVAEYQHGRFNQVQDLASRYKFDPLIEDQMLGELVAEHLGRLFDRYGPPLVLKRDNGSNLNHEAVNQLLADYGVIPLNSPCRYPRYNGAIERSQREVKEGLDERADVLLALPDRIRLSVQEQNHRLRPCLEGLSSSAVFYRADERLRSYDRQKRKEINDWITQETMGILCCGGRCNWSPRAWDAAWRRAVETWLRREGLMTVSVGKSVTRFSLKSVS